MGSEDKIKALHMEEILKKIYIKIRFLFMKFLKRNELISQIEGEYLGGKEKIRKKYKDKLQTLEKDREKNFLKNHIDFNLNCFRLIRYKNKHLGERCFIVGNGPSLQAKDLEKIKDEYSFGCNKIYKIFNDTNWRPTYYFVTDSLTHKNSYKEIKRINCPKFISDIALDREKLPLMSNGIKIFIHLNYQDTYPEYPPLTVDLTKELWSVYNVGYQMLNAAIYMGFKEIYLLGMDLSYDFSKAETIVKQTKSGELNRVLIVAENDENHFIKNYWEPGEENHDTDTKYAFKGFELIEKESQNLGIKVYNATRGGKLEIFERVNLDNIVK